VVGFTESRLDVVARVLGDNDYLLGRFSAADVLLTTVLRMLRDTNLVEARPVLAAYQRRCEQRPAFQKALADQLACFERHAPAQA
jgi:glutathione S-transferase